MQQTIKQYFKTLQIIHIALIAGITMFTIVVVFLNAEQQPDDSFNSLFILVCPVLLILGFLGGNFLFKSQINNIKSETSFLDKLGNYRTASTIKWALLEGPALFSVIAFLLTSNYLYIGLVIISIVLFLLNRPSKEKFTFEVELNREEKLLLQNDDYILEL